MLQAAFNTSCSGAATIALVSGVSGMGKSALVQRFLARLESDANALVLRALLQGSNIRYLAALFSALKRVKVLAQLMAANGSEEIRDLRERKRLAFRGFRDLCRQLARERPLVLFIDDLQWGDRDSAPLFQELMVGPDAPAVLVVCAYRSEDEARSPLVALLKDLHKLDENVMRLLDIQVTALSQADATLLAKSVLEAMPDAEAAAALIAREAEGSPFFVRELAAFIGERGVQAASSIRLDTLIQAQLDALAPESRELLALIAVAGRPIARRTLTAASALGSRTFNALRELEGRRLVSTKRSDAGERIECYHDRILYRGTPRPSLERVARAWNRGLFLRQVAGVRVDMLYTRGRLALAVARERQTPSLLRRAVADARALQRLHQPWSSALGTLLLAGAASLEH